MEYLDRYSKEHLEKTLSALSSLVIYSRLKSDPVLTGLRHLLADIISLPQCENMHNDTSEIPVLYVLMEKYTEIYSLLLQNNLSLTPDLSDYVFTLVQNDDNAFSRAASGRYSGSHEPTVDPQMKQCVLGDMERILTIVSFPSRIICSLLSTVSHVALPEWRHDTSGQTPAELFDNLSGYHREKSFGVFSRCHAFLWKNHSLEPVPKPDPIRLDQMISYTYEISRVQENTLRLLRHKRAENLLLFGARGTGKSSTVKAMANKYKNQGLRLIEVHKDELLTIAELLSYLADLSDVRLSFIIFLDDLTFSEDETGYTVLKTLLEGGIKTRPDNVAIYATSNRRHLVAEKETNEMYANDAKDEKLSLSDRFGISIRFASPNQQIYLEIVYGILTDRQVPFDREIVAQQALTWSMRENGRSPRTARQFADYYESMCETVPDDSASAT